MRVLAILGGFLGGTVAALGGSFLFILALSSSVRGLVLRTLLIMLMGALGGFGGLISYRRPRYGRWPLGFSCAGLVIVMLWHVLATAMNPPPGVVVLQEIVSLLVITVPAALLLGGATWAARRIHRDDLAATSEQG